MFNESWIPIESSKLMLDTIKTYYTRLIHITFIKPYKENVYKTFMTN